jgi:hypothetical protein
MKKVLIALVVAASIFVLYRIGAGYYESHMVVMSAPPPPPPIGIEAGPVKVSVDENTSWMAIAKALVTILSTYLGIKLINKYVKA